MHAFIEWLPEDARIGIIRAGPEASEYGREFDFAAVVVVHGGVAEICALTKDSHTELRRAHVEAAITIVRRECNVLPKWKRIKGDRTMARHNIPHVDRNHDALTQAHALEEVARAVKHGEVHFENPIQVSSKADLLAAVNAMPEFTGTFVGAVRVDH